MKSYRCLCIIAIALVVGVVAGWFLKGHASNRPIYFYPTWRPGGFVDRYGDALPLGRFDDGRQFSDGRAAVRIGEKWGFIDLKGAVVIPPQFDDAMGYSEGLCPVLIGDKWGYIDWNGHIAIPPQFERVFPFSEGLAAYSEGEFWGYIDRNGTIAIPAQYGDARAFSEGLAAVDTKDRLWGYIDRSGEFVVQPFDCTMVQEFHWGSALVRIGTDPRWRRIDWQGQFVD